jgi:DNA-binding transcriptional LysR family regulator
MEFRYLRYMLAVKDHGSIRQAATALGISASVISRRIRDI